MAKELVRRTKTEGAGDLLSELRKLKVPAAYRYERQGFLSWLEASGTPLGEAVAGWKKELQRPYSRPLANGKPGKKRRRAAKTVNKALDAAIYLLRSLLDRSPDMPVADRYAISQAILKQGKRLKVERKPPRFLTFEELDRLIGETKGTDPKLSLWIEVLAATGMRVSEMAGLLWTDARPINGHSELRIAGKGGKERTLEVETALLDRAREVFADETFIFGHHGKPYSRELISMKIKRAAGKILNRPDVSAHVCRHSFATHLIGEGAGIQAVQHDLGHSSVSTTLDIYVHTKLTHEERQRLLSIRHQEGGKG